MAKTSGPYSAYINKSGSSVYLYWSYLEGSSRAIYFSIQRCVNNGSWTTIVSNQVFNKYDYYDPIQSGWKTVQYGVKVHAQYSFDTDSDWTTTSTLTVNSAPTTPSGPYLPSSIQGGSSCSVSWGASTDPDGNLSGYKLERSLNGGGWSQVYSGSSTSYSDTIGTGYTTVAYRVKAYDSAGAESGYATSSTQSIINNRAPSMPASITVPPVIYGGSSCSVSWAAASDADGNLSGYKLERSLNGGAWNQIYSGSGRSYSDTIGTGYTTVAYRVRAYDSQGATSGFKISSTYSIVNNVAPTVPVGLTTPKTIRGGQEVAISWSASTDADGNLSGYILQRQVDGGSWTQIYKGANCSYTDTADAAWKTVAYQVCAYDSLSAASKYETSPVISVVNNAAPVIAIPDNVSEDMGTQTGAFSFSYSVSDEDEGDVITVTETVDGVKKRSFTAESGKSYTLNITAAEWIQILNGSHSLTVTATDSYNGSTTRTITFSKNETQIELTLAQPLAADAMIWRALVNVVRQVPENVIFHVEACNNGFDETPTWEDVTDAIEKSSKFFFTNKTKTAENWGFNFRLTVDRNGVEGDCFITSVGGNFE